MGVLWIITIVTLWPFPSSLFCFLRIVFDFGDYMTDSMTEYVPHKCWNIVQNVFLFQFFCIIIYEELVILIFKVVLYLEISFYWLKATSDGLIFLSLERCWCYNPTVFCMLFRNLHIENPKCLAMIYQKCSRHTTLVVCWPQKGTLLLSIKRDYYFF